MRGDSKMVYKKQSLWEPAGQNKRMDKSCRHNGTTAHRGCEGFDLPAIDGHDGQQDLDD